MVLVLESIDAALLSIRLDGDITAWDRRAELLCGWSASEVLGKSLADTVIAPDYRGAFKMNLAEYRSGHESALVGRRIAIFALHRDGHPIPVELGLWSQGSGRGFSALMHDISDRLDTHSKKAAAQ
jgi:PAS domain S-box-containing protein